MGFSFLFVCLSLTACLTGFLKSSFLADIEFPRKAAVEVHRYTILPRQQNGPGESDSTLSEYTSVTIKSSARMFLHLFFSRFASGRPLLLMKNKKSRGRTCVTGIAHRDDTHNFRHFTFAKLLSVQALQHSCNQTRNSHLPPTNFSSSISSYTPDAGCFCPSPAKRFDNVVSGVLFLTVNEPFKLALAEGSRLWWLGFI